MNSALKKYSTMEPCWTKPLIIEIEINGLRTKEQNKTAATTHEELTREAIKVYDEGASIIHSHNTNFALRGKEAFEDYKKIWEPVLKERPNIFWYGTTCASWLVPQGEHGLEHVELLGKYLNVKMASLDVGNDNIAFATDKSGYLLGGPPYGWNLDQINGQIDMVRRNNLACVFGVYEPGYMKTALSLIDRGIATKGSNIDLYFMDGVLSGLMQPTNEALYFYLYMLEGYNIEWNALICVNSDMDYKPFMKRVIELGGHIKFGHETFFSPTRQPSNTDLLHEIQDIAAKAGRPVATPEEAQKIYGIISEGEEALK
jgi:uncharacterized protein (DUF849 family)